MAYYSKEEQETLLGYCAAEDCGTVYTTIPADIRKYREFVYDFKEEMDDEGRVIVLSGKCDKKQIKLVKPRVKREYTEEERQVLAERMRLNREKKNS